MKKFLLIFLAFLSCVSASAYDFAVANADGQTLYYNILSDSDVALTEVGEYETNYKGVINIPDIVSFNGKSYSVTMIADKTLHGNNDVTSITIPNSVSKLGFLSVCSCPNLKTLTIGTGLVESGGSILFSLENLETLYYNATSFDVELSMYGYPNLKNVVIGENVKNLPGYFLYGCENLTSVIISDGVECIRDAAFSQCTNLQTITFGKSLKYMASAFSGCDNLTTIYYNVENFIGHSEESSLTEFSLKSPNLIIGNNVKNLPEDFMKRNSLLSHLDLGSGLQSIGSYAFYGCEELTSVIIPNSVTYIGNGAFGGCGKISSLVIGEGVKTIDKYAFDNLVNLPSLEFNAIDCVVNESFDFATILSKVKIGPKVKSFNSKCLYYNYALTAFEVDPSNPYLTTVDGVVFSKDMNTLVKFPPGKSGQEYEIPSGVKTIDNYAFFSHPNTLKSVTIPASVTNIGVGAFEAYYRLDDVYCYAMEPPTMTGTNVFNNSYSSATLHVPANSVNKYKSANEWKKFRKFDYIHVAPTQISIPATATVMHGETITLTATFLPDNATDTETSWWSDNVLIASVNDYGVVTGESVGETTITATCGNLSASCIVTVTPQPNRLEAENISTLINTNVDYPISLVCADKFTSLEFDFKLPNNVSLRRDQNYEYFITLSNRAKYHDYSITYKNNVYHVSIYSLQRDEFMGNSGELFSLPLSVTGDAAIVNIAFSNIKATKKDNTAQNFLNLNAPLEIKVLKGDANGDNIVTIADFTGVIAKSANTTVRNFVQSAADVNEDGTIDLEDAISILDLVLSADQSLTDFSESVTEESQQIYGLSASNTESEEILRLNLKNSYSSMRDIQFALTLPEGVYIEQDEYGYYDITINDERANRYRATCKYIDGVYRIAISSSTVRNIMYGDDWIADIKLTWGDPVGTVPFKLHNIHFSGFNNNSEVQDIPVVNYEGTITLDQQGGVDDILVDSTFSIKVSDMTVNIFGLAETDVVSIYNLSGQLIYNGTEHSIRLSEHGVYIVRVNSKTEKVIL